MENAVHSRQGPTAEAEEAWALLRTLFGHHRRAFLIAASQLDLHPAQAGALLHLAAPLPMSELATCLACDNSNVTGLVDRLEGRGLVTRKLSPDDRRVKHVLLTPAGERIRAQLLARFGPVRESLNSLSVPQQRQLRDLLEEVLNRIPAS
jgi:MarR family transcriptional regulator, organic hydroperoxide resistance regulator